MHGGMWWVKYGMPGTSSPCSKDEIVASGDLVRDGMAAALIVSG